ncbi:MAG: 50S ribosomal protein L21 [Burkholderiales bacterium]|nr:MAG: 50S ribosomal protein L21 [Burkholderiales bacterium]
MYAVIKTGGKQYKVCAGDKIKVEQIPADIGAEVAIEQVLAVSEGDQIKVGSPLLAGATVSATVLAHGRHPKLRIFKMRRRKHYQKRAGHRQNFTELFVHRIVSELGEATAQVPAAAAQADDLTRIEGVGPKIAKILADGGIGTYQQLAEASVEQLQALLEQAGSRFASHDPTTWPEQAALAARGDWEAFEKLTTELDGGRRK